jgi:hypothetical protein
MIAFALLYALTGLVIAGRSQRIAKGDLPLHSYIQIGLYWPLFLLIYEIIKRRN